MKNCLIAMTVICPCLMFAGCGPAGTVVEGKVMLSDGTPAPRGAVMLNGPTGSYTGIIGSDGTFKMNDPVLDGTYKVAVTGVNDRDAVDAGDDSMAYTDDGEFKETDPSTEPKSLIEDKYAIPAQSGLTMTVPSESYDITVDVKK